MHWHVSKECFESVIHVRLVGLAIGITYWVIGVIYLIKESFIVIRYYYEYLSSQNNHHIEYVQIVETIVYCLIVVGITILTTLERIVLMSKAFIQERNLLIPHTCAKCRHKKWQKKKQQQIIYAGTAWLKTM